MGIILDIKVIDYLFIRLKSYLSFQDIGLLVELEESTKWVPNFALGKKIRKEEKELRKFTVEAAKIKGRKLWKKEGFEEDEKKGRIEMAKEMKKAGEPIEKI